MVERERRNAFTRYDGVPSNLGEKDEETNRRFLYFAFASSVQAPGIACEGLVVSRAKQRERRKIIALLAERFPHCFSIQVPRAPLKIGIHAEVLAALNGTVKPDQLQRALAKYTSVPGYLRSIVPGTSRWDLYGSSAGVVTHEEAAYAKAKMGKLCQQAIDPANREILISHAAITAAR